MKTIVYVRAKCATAHPAFCRAVYRLCEKKTDVNLTSDLIAGAFLGQYEQAVVCTNDSDLAPTMAAVRRHCPQVRLGLVVPVPGSSHRGAGRDLLRQAQLPTKIPHTSLYQPHLWRPRVDIADLPVL